MLDLHLDGVPQLSAALRRLSSDVEDVAEDAAASGAALIVRNARAVAPRRTGRLRASITTQPQGVASHLVRATARYAPYVAYGSIHNPQPVPFLEIGTARAVPKILAAVERGVDSAAGRV